VDHSLLALARANPILRGLASVTIKRLLSLGQKVEIAPQVALVRQGDQSDCAYLILDGDLEVRVSTAYGEVLVAQATRGSLIGEIGAFADLPRNATVRASSTVRALRLDRASLLDAGDADPSLLRSVITQLGSRIGRFNNAIGLYTNAVAALEQDDFDVRILDELKHPSPELVDFTQHFRRMAEQIIRRREQQAEMASAAAIQRAMLPIEQPASVAESRFDIFSQMKPARQVGGDLYDIVELGDNRLMITIGDVCGKGVPAALFMAVAQTVMRLTVRSDVDLQAQINEANKLLIANNREDMFATLFCAVLDRTSGTILYCNCGHNPPLILSVRSSSFQSLRASGPPLGITGTATYSPQSISLNPGDLLLLYTDGVTEAENADSVQFGTDRLKQALIEARGEHSRRVVEHVFERVSDFSNGAPQSDDITCTAVIHKEQ
jgi:phosphoserine phosphatase RsbU/P